MKKKHFRFLSTSFESINISLVLVSAFTLFIIFLFFFSFQWRCNQFVFSVVHSRKLHKFCNRYEKREQLMDMLTNGFPNGTIIFVERKLTADFLASFLSESGIATTSIHGDRKLYQRAEALYDFFTGRMRVLVSTNVIGPRIGNYLNFNK